MKKKANQGKETLPNNWGDSFVTIPRNIFDWVFSPDLATRQKGLLSLFLWRGCHYADSKITIKGGYGVLCRRSEYIASQIEIAEKLKNFKMTEWAVKSNLKKLKEEGLIKVERVNVKKKDKTESVKTLASRIRVLGYDDYNKPPSDSGQPKPKPYVTTPKKQNPPVKEDEDDDDDWFEGFIPDPQMCA